MDGDGQRPLKIEMASLRAGNQIAPRPWLYGTQFMRQFVTTLIAPGGVGKTAITMGIGVSCAFGRGLLGQFVFERINVLFLSLEDPRDEFDRRMAAFYQHHDIDREELAGRIFVAFGRDRLVNMASLDLDGSTVVFPDKQALIALCLEHDIGLVIVDPFVNSHSVDENSNTQMNAAVRAWNEVAEAINAAIGLIHHTRKGAIAGDADSARGASALISGSRVALTLTPMDAEIAEKYGVPDRERRLYIRLDDAKRNMSPPADAADWFRLASVRLDNATPIYQHGDNVQAAEQWEPPSMLAQQTPADIHLVLDRIEQGPQPGSRYSASKRGGSSRWVGNVIMDLLGLNETQARDVANTWLRTGLLVETTYDDPNARRETKGVYVEDAKRPTL